MYFVERHQRPMDAYSKAKQLSLAREEEEGKKGMDKEL